MCLKKWDCRLGVKNLKIMIIFAMIWLEALDNEKKLNWLEAWSGNLNDKVSYFMDRLDELYSIDE